MNNKGILGIENRTENWKTAHTIAPLITFGRQNKLANMIINNSENSAKSFGEDAVILELYWKGFRDLYHQENKSVLLEKAWQLYVEYFSNLRTNIEEYNNWARDNKQPKLNLYNENNYSCSTSVNENFSNNLLNTEIDIVLNAPGFLLIGEAKYEQTFGAASIHVLTHQLIRQYVMAKIVIDITKQDSTIKIIPFIIGDNAKRTAQVQLINRLGWLSMDNVITWNQFEEHIRNWVCNYWDK